MHIYEEMAASEPPFLLFPCMKTAFRIKNALIH